MPTNIDTTTILWSVIGVLIAVSGTLLMTLTGIVGYFLASLHSRFEQHITQSDGDRDRLTRLEERFGVVDQIKAAMDEILQRLERRKEKRDDRDDDGESTD